MGVKVREKPKGSKIYWVFINHAGVRKSKKIGKDKKLADDVARNLDAKLILKDFDMEAFNKKVPTLKQYAEKWFQLPHKTGKATLKGYKRTLELHVYPNLGNRPLDQINGRISKSFLTASLQRDHFRKQYSEH